MLTLDDSEKILCDLQIPEIYASVLKRGLKINAKFLAYKEKNYIGLIDSVASRIDAQTRSILARAKINNKNLLGRTIKIKIDNKILENSIPKDPIPVDNEEPDRIEADKKVWKETLNGINLSDILTINNWINYADKIGDYSYKKICRNKINNPFINKILQNQLEFRKNQIQI